MGFMDTLSEVGGFAASLGNFVQSFFALIRIIQRCSATIEFKAKLSPDMGGLFSWAPDILNTLFNDIMPLEHLTEKDTLILLGFAFYLCYAFLFLSVYKSASISFWSLFSGLIFCIMGYGTSLLPKWYGWILIFFYPIIFIASIVGIFLGGWGAIIALLIIPLITIFRVLKKAININHYKKEYDKWDIRIGVWIALIVFAFTSAPVICKKDRFSITLICSIVAIIIVEIFITKKFEDKMADYFTKGFQILSSCFVIPIISNFTELTKAHDSIEWQMSLFIIVIPLLSTFLLTTLLTLAKYSTITKEYRDGYHYFEIFDLVCKYAYAFFSGYDSMFWGCIVVELITLIAILVVRPYRDTSKYGLNIGECVVVIIANLIAKYYKGVFSLAVSLIILVLGFSPIILSLFLFFALDLGNEKPKKLDVDLRAINVVIVIIVFIGFFLYGLCIPSLYKFV